MSGGTCLPVCFVVLAIGCDDVQAKGSKAKGLFGASLVSSSSVKAVSAFLNAQAVHTLRPIFKHILSTTQ